MQALLGSYRWDRGRLRGELAGLAAAWLPCDPDDVIGPGAAIDETAQLKHGDGTACAAPQHAGITGQAENCVTAVFSAYVATFGQAWADFDVYMPDRWAEPGRRQAAGIPGDLVMTTKPDLAVAQLGRLITRRAARHVRRGVTPQRQASRGMRDGGPGVCGHRPASLQHHPGLRRRDPRGRGGKGCGVRAALVRNKDQGTRLADWALADTASPRHFLLIRRLISRPDQLRKRSKRARTCSAGTSARPGPGTPFAGHRPGRARPAPPRRHPQRPVRPHRPAARQAYPARPGNERIRR